MPGKPSDTGSHIRTYEVYSKRRTNTAIPDECSQLDGLAAFDYMISIALCKTDIAVLDLGRDDLQFRVFQFYGRYIQLYFVGIIFSLFCNIEHEFRFPICNIKPHLHGYAQFL